jgi:hypothetical protein
VRVVRLVSRDQRHAEGNTVKTKEEARQETEPRRQEIEQEPPSWIELESAVPLKRIKEITSLSPQPLMPGRRRASAQ